MPMHSSNRTLALLALAAAPTIVTAQTSRAAPTDLDAFNRALAAATRHMDNAATMALWSDDGVSLLPSTKPIVGKATIAKFIDAATTSHPGAHMESFDLRCHDVTVSGDWASEWCLEHQIVRFADGSAPFDGWGHLVFVLHRAADGQWRIKTEMWNQALPDSTVR